MEETGGEVDKTTTIYVFPYHTNEEGEKSEEKVEVSTSDVVEEVTTATEEEVTTQYVEEVVEIDNENVIVANVMAASENGSIKLVLSEEDSNLEEHGYTTSYRPIRPVERQKMRPWLLDHLDQGSIPGLSWQNRQQRIFRISWKHAAHNCFDKIRDSDLFERWAYHTGRHHDGNHKRWKANFRCALNSLPDVIELRDLGVRKGDNAFKVYKFIDLTDEKEREEKKRLQMVTRQSKKGDKKGGSGIGSPLLTPKQIKKDPHSPAAFSITTSDGGMLQTLLHAIELKNKEAASAGSDTPKEKVQVTVKRTAHPSTESKHSKRIKIERARGNSESTESSDETDDETESQESMKSENTDSTPNTPTSGQSVLSTLKLPLIDMRQLLAHVTAGKMQFAGGDKSEDTQNLKVTIPCTVLEALQARKLITEPINKHTIVDNKEKTVSLQTTEETAEKTASTDHDVKLIKTELNKDMPKLAAALNKPLQPVQTGSGTNVRPQLVSKLNISGAQETRRQVVRNRLATKINTGGEQAMYGQVIKDNVVSSVDQVIGGNVGPVLFKQVAPSQSFEKVTVQAIPQLQTVSLADNLQEGKTGTQGSSCEEEELLPENAEGHKTDSSTAMDINVENVVVSTPDATSSLSNQVTIDLADLTEENLSAEVTGELEEKQYRCLWCQLNFPSKLELLSHFISLHQEMLLPEETQGEEKVAPTETSTVTPTDSDGALDLSKPKVTIEKNPGTSYTNVVDLSFNRIEDEALDLSNSKKNLVVNEIHVPTQERPQYSLNSLIEALRNTIEQDRKEKKLPGDSFLRNVEDKDSDAVSKSVMKFVDLSSDSENSDVAEIKKVESNSSDVKISVKTFTVNGKTMFRCTKCNKVFSKSCTLSRHALVHTQLYPYFCGICDSKFRDMRVLLRHLDWHGENVDCPCKKCEKVNEGKGQGTNEKLGKGFKFRCDICGKQFMSVETCKAHVDAHKSGSTPLVCSICKMKFSCNRILSRHRMCMHSLQNCPVCMESTADLAAHMKNHPGIFIYRCGLCTDGFNRRPDLHDHLRVHTFFGSSKLKNQMRRRVKPLSRTKTKGKKLKQTKSSSGTSAKQTGQNEEIDENIKVETFDENNPGTFVTKALIVTENLSDTEAGTEEQPEISIGNIPNLAVLKEGIEFTDKNDNNVTNKKSIKGKSTSERSIKGGSTTEKSMKNGSTTEKSAKDDSIVDFSNVNETSSADISQTIKSAAERRNISDFSVHEQFVNDSEVILSSTDAVVKAVMEESHMKLQQIMMEAQKHVNPQTSIVEKNKNIETSKTHTKEVSGLQMDSSLELSAAKKEAPLVTSRSTVCEASSLQKPGSVYSLVESKVSPQETSKNLKTEAAGSQELETVQSSVEGNKVSQGTSPIPETETWNELQKLEILHAAAEETDASQGNLPRLTVESSRSPSSGMSLRRRSSRRCRWHDNDSVCERCDVTFVKKIAFGRKTKKTSDETKNSTGIVFNQEVSDDLKTDLASEMETE